MNSFFAVFSLIPQNLSFFERIKNSAFQYILNGFEGFRNIAVAEYSPHNEFGIIFGPLAQFQYLVG